MEKQISALKTHYLTQVLPALQKEYKYTNPHQLPKLVKIEVSAGLGLQAQNRAFLQKAIEEIRIVTGQHPVLTKAKNSVAGFKIREGMPLGLMTTLRGEKMYAFLEKMITLVLPRIRDFRGLNVSQFDRDGNYNFGITDQLIFPEIDYDSVEQKRGFNITIVTTAKNPQEGFSLLKQLGLPFAKEENEK